MQTDVRSEPGGLFVTVRGRFYRSVRAADVGHALTGSRSPGRYAPASTSVLYMSASPQGVEAAMTDYRALRTEPSVICELEVDAQRIFDLRDANARALAGVDLHDAIGDWKAALADGRTPASWALAERLRNLGAQGLIDPSRKAPGLWHLALFCWNDGSGVAVSVSGTLDTAD